jgi:signal peptidase I
MRHVSQLLRRSLVSYTLVLVGAIALALALQAFVVKPFAILSPSMANTINTGDRILIDRVTYHFRGIHRGDVVVFDGHGPIPLLKRVVGLPGDVLSLHDGCLYVNSKPAPQSFIRQVRGDAEPTLPGPDAMEPWSLARPYTVPAGMYFVMGDNRSDSADSRYWGLVARHQIIGRGLAVYWPLDHLRGL